MKYVIIRINDISDIDTSRISVYDLNNRYVDTLGNMYGLKYNKSLRKIEVIKIVRTHEKNAAGYRQMISQNKKARGEASDTVEPSGYEEGVEEAILKVEEFNPETFIENTMELVRTHRERLKGIIMNIRNSNIVVKENKTESNQLDDIFRNLEIDGIQAAENLANYQKELINYPRSLTYYQAKMDERARTIIETLSSSNSKVMRFIYLVEMLDNIRALYRVIEKSVRGLKSFLDERNSDDTKWSTNHEKQSYRDGIVSIETTMNEIEKLQDNLRLLEEYAYTPEHFA
ncbi:MAG: hypothetical protein E4G96_03585 [Chrysiogenales bacterium]|nr:MAG: hypothetical protein E4G96_03585 [Chrysiogenales bacterium]